MVPISTVSSGLTKKQCFCSWLAQDLPARLFCHLSDLLLTQSIFLNVFYVIMFLSVEGSDEEYNYFFINKSSFLHRDLLGKDIRELPADSFKNMESLQIL